MLLFVNQILPKGVYLMPIYKVDGVKKDGLQKYRVVINYTDTNGKHRKKEKSAFGSTAAKELERQMSLDANQSSCPSYMKFSELYEEYKKVISAEIRKTTADKKLQRTNQHILPFFENIPLHKITVRNVQEWKTSIEEKRTSLGKHYKHNTKKDLYKELSAIFNYAVRMEYISKNPCKNVGNFKEQETTIPDTAIHYYTPEQFKQFIEVAKTNATRLYDWDFYVFFCIAFYTGMRKGEILALKWADINGEYIKVTRAISQKIKGGDIEGPPKTKSSIRTLQIPLPLKRILEEQKTRQRSISAFTEEFRICGGVRCLRDSSISNRNFSYAKEANLPHIKVHDFRHSHATLLANEGINIQEIARRLGHSDVKMTWNTYSHLYPREEERAVKILNKI